MLLEVPNKVNKVFSLPFNHRYPTLKSGLVIIQTDTISIIHGENGSLYNHHDFSRNVSYGQIIDCVFLEKLSVFVVAFKDSSLVVLPIECKNTLDCEHIIWPKQAKQLLSHDGKSITGYFEGGYLLNFTLSNSYTLPKYPSVWKSSLSYLNEDLFVIANNQSIVVAAVTSLDNINSSTSTVSQKKRKSVSIVSDLDRETHNRIHLTKVDVPRLLEESCLILEKVDTIVDNIDLKPNEKLLSLHSHNKTNSFSLIISSNNTSSSNISGRWLKCSLDGSILFERMLSSENKQLQPMCTSCIDNQLYIISNQSILTVYDLKYGTELQSIVLNNNSNTSLKQPASSIWFVLYEHQLSKNTSENIINTTSNAVVNTNTMIINKTLHLITITSISSTHSYNINQCLISIPALPLGTSSLAMSIGKLHSTTTLVKNVINNISVENKEKLQELLTIKCCDNNQHKLGKPNDFHIYMNAINEFLNYIDSKDGSPLLDWDWDTMNALLKTSSVSLKTYPNVLSKAIKFFRFDTIAAIVEFSVDLSEYAYIKIISDIIILSDDAMFEWIIVDGLIKRNFDLKSSTSKKNKRTSLKSKDGDVDVLIESHSDNQLNVFTFLRAVIEASLRRKAAFSCILLSEAVRHLPLSTAILLLRIITHLLRGLCTVNVANNNDRTTISNSYLYPHTTDLHVKRTITLAEAILDGHFSSLAIHAADHIPTRRALINIMTAITGAVEASEKLETLLGVWTHINRVIYEGSQQSKPITSLYQVERITLF